ncbi:CHAT domain-containing protein [Baaleninema simplex]|uniref:CHAT domain-containing protein n=1 Tax=Baaleninema simplex TaxID=2862350 RepID=UPI000364B780|nr:CHAT domain-containing protein [Baaleninema simplex]
MKTFRFYVVLSTLTFLLVTTGVPAVARFVPNSAALSPTPTALQEANPTAETGNLIERGKQFYETGQYDRAAEIWQTAAQSYRERGDVLNAALSQAYLSLAYQNLGQWEPASRVVDEAIASLDDLPSTTSDRFLVRAIALNAKGRLLLERGQAQNALLTWQDAEVAYERAENESGRIGSQINQTQALQALGQYQRARDRLEDLVTRLEALPDSPLAVEALRNLGVTLQVVGDIDKSQEVLERSLAIAQRLGLSNDVLASQFALANIARDRGNTDDAIAYYQYIVSETRGQLRRDALLNQLSLLVRADRWDDARALLPQVRTNLDTGTVDRASIYSRVNFATSLMKLHDAVGEVSDSGEIADLLAEAVGDARDLDDARAESYSLGQLGHLYEHRQQWPEAQDLTERALTVAQTIDALDLVARWEWQLGRLFAAQRQAPEALTVYRNTIDVLGDLRKDLVAIDPDVQFSYRESVEPVYREFVGLLLDEADKARNASDRQQILTEARNTLEALRLAELDNFFREACLEVQPVSIEQIDERAAVLYTVLLSDRLAVVLSVPGEPLQLYETFTAPTDIDRTVEQFLQSLNPAYDNEVRLSYAKQLYDRIVGPAEALLDKHDIETLVFVLDGQLRNVPMAALFDGEQYLIEKYSLALTQSLQLFQTRRNQDGTVSVMAGGLSEARQGFSAIPEVEREVSLISQEVSSDVLLNESFTREALVRKLDRENFEILHLATHGQFSSNAEDTFLLTWDDRINVKELGRVLQTTTDRNINPLDLLVLSACQTAAGDDRATLGLAGFALRSGARSTIATLWSVQDEPTASLMVEFYKQLNRDPNISKAEALRRSQVALLTEGIYDHPAFWAPFVLVGNWM